MSRRRFVAQLIDRSGLSQAILFARRLKPSAVLPVLTYHRLCPEGESYAFDEGVVDATPATFEKQMQLVKKHFHSVTISELCDFVKGGTLPPNSIAITFDDGYLDNYTEALPILQRTGVHAIFFVSTRYIEAREMFWWDRIAYVFKTTTKERLTLSYPSALVFNVRGDRSSAINQALRLAKDYYGLDLERFLTELTKVGGVEWNHEIEKRYANELLMTWDHVRALKAAGMDVESHTRTHRVLQTLSPEQLDEELNGARTDVQRELGYLPRAISYPVGRTISGSPHIRAAVEKAGYEVGFSNASGINRIDSLADRFELKRIAIDLDYPTFYFRSILAVPMLIR